MIEDVGSFCVDLGLGGVVCDTVSLCSPGWPRTHYADQAGLELTWICQPLPPKCSNEKCGHMCVHSYVQIQVHMCAYMCGGQRSASCVILQMPSPFIFWRQSPFIGLRLPLGWAGRPVSPKDPPVCVSTAGAEIMILMMKLSFLCEYCCSKSGPHICTASILPMGPSSLPVITGS